MDDFLGIHFDPDLVGPDGRLTRFHKGGARGPSKTQKKAEALQVKVLQGQLAQLEKASKEKIHVPEPPPPPPPPPQRSSFEVDQASTTARRDRQRRRGISSTILAGETGGYGGALSGQLGGQKTMLG